MSLGDFADEATVALLKGAARVPRTPTRSVSLFASAYGLRRLLQRNQNKGLSLLINWELATTPPTIGDTFGAFVLARVLTRMGFRVTFAFDFSGGLRADWKSLDPHDRVWLFETWHRILSELQFSESQIQIVNLKSCSDRQTSFEAHDLVLRSSAPLYKTVPRLLNLLWRTNRLNAPAREAFFVDSIRPSFHDLKDMGIFQPYVTWNVRTADYDHARNINNSEIIKIYEQLCEYFPKSQIVLLSNDRGVKRVQEAIRTCTIPTECASRLVPQPKDDFLVAMRLLLGSRAFVQHLGGGIGVVALYSHVPMFTSMFTPGSYPNPRGKKLMEWSAQTQNYILIGRDREYSDALEKWFDSL